MFNLTSTKWRQCPFPPFDRTSPQKRRQGLREIIGWIRFRYLLTDPPLALRLQGVVTPALHCIRSIHPCPKKMGQGYQVYIACMFKFLVQFSNSRKYRQPVPMHILRAKDDEFCMLINIYMHISVDLVLNHTVYSVQCRNTRYCTPIIHCSLLTVRVISH